MVGRMCETGRFKAGNERVKELWMMRVAQEDDVTCIGKGESETERLG